MGIVKEFKDEVEIECRILYEGTAAYSIDYDGDEHWIPYSQVEDIERATRKGELDKLIIPIWLAKKKGML